MPHLGVPAPRGVSAGVPASVRPCPEAPCPDPRLTMDASSLLVRPKKSITGLRLPDAALPGVAGVLLPYMGLLVMKSSWGPGVSVRPARRPPPLKRLSGDRLRGSLAGLTPSSAAAAASGPVSAAPLPLGVIGCGCMAVPPAPAGAAPFAVPFTAPLVAVGCAAAVFLLDLPPLKRLARPASMPAMPALPAVPGFLLTDFWPSTSLGALDVAVLLPGQEGHHAEEECDAEHRQNRAQDVADLVGQSDIYRYDGHRAQQRDGGDVEAPRIARILQASSTLPQ